MLITIVFFFALLLSLFLVIGTLINILDKFKLNKSTMLILMIVISLLWSLLFYLLN